MILSASVNADVPARFGSWFQRRLDEGYLRVAGSDPWKQRKIALDREHVDGIVFWTRDVTPFLPGLDALHSRGIAFVVHYALTGEVKRAAPAAISAMRTLGERFDPRVVVWRYDPVVLDAQRPAESHVQAFTALAHALAGIVDEAIVAFARPPSSGRARVRRDPSRADAVLHPAPSGERRDLVRGLARVARDHAMRLSVCADAEALAPGSSPARCIDVRRLGEVAGRPIEAPTAGFMHDCLCARAIDIGDHGGTAPECFCGAQGKRRSRQRHDAQSEFLFEPDRRFRSLRSDDLPF